MYYLFSLLFTRILFYFFTVKMKEKQIESEQLDSGEFSDNSQFKYQLNDREDHVSVSNNFDLAYREDEVNTLPESLSNLKLKSKSNYYSKFRIYIQYVNLCICVHLCCV